jgi:hypothetical protein
LALFHNEQEGIGVGVSQVGQDFLTHVLFPASECCVEGIRGVWVRKETGLAEKVPKVDSAFFAGDEVTEAGLNLLTLLLCEFRSGSGNGSIVCHDNAP